MPICVIEICWGCYYVLCQMSTSIHTLYKLANININLVYSKKMETLIPDTLVKYFMKLTEN